MSMRFPETELESRKCGEPWLETRREWREVFSLLAWADIKVDPEPSFKCDQGISKF
jgi:hypothetical protein